MPLREILADQMLRPLVQCLTDLGAEAAIRERNRLAGDGLAVEPGRALGPHLRTEIKIGADSERDAARTLRIFIGAQLDD